MKTYFASKQIKYDGSQIEAHWAYKTFDISGDNIVSFSGLCDITPDYMVDLEDLKNNERIYSPLMLHFIIEHFDSDLDKAILRQRLLSMIVKETLEDKIGHKLTRQGDDIFDGPAKLSISIATATPISTKIHFGINIESQGTPVLTRGLKDYFKRYSVTMLNRFIKRFAQTVMKRYAEELLAINHARSKVRGVK